MASWNLVLSRLDPVSLSEVQHDTVLVFDEETSTHTLGGTMIALAYTTSVVTVDNGDGTFDFVMHRDDPYTGDPIGDLAVLQGFVEDPEGQWPTAEAMRAALRWCISYIPEDVE